MNKKLKNFLKFLLFVGFGAILFYLVYKDSDFNEIFEKMADIKWGWFVPAITVMMASHASRAARWNLLLESSGDYKPRFLNTFFAVMNMYFVNLALPRVGEVTRSGLVSRYDKIPLSKVLGTMVTERATDLFLLILLTIVTFFLQGHVIGDFFTQNPDAKEKFGFLFNAYFWIVLGAFAVLGIVFLIMLAKGKFDRIRFFAKAGEFIRSFTGGLLSIFKLKRPLAYIAHSIFIYVMYFSMLRLCFPAFPGIESLGVMAALTIFVAGSYGMVAPVPNGAGAWHYMTIQTMLIYGVLPEDAKVFALVVHGMQMIMLIITGLLATLGLPLINRKRL